MRIAVVGPVSPFRSGVANHTTALASALGRMPGVTCKAFSFSRLYPKALFPGAGDRDEAAGPVCEVETEFGLDTMNPLTWHTTRRRIGRFAPDLVVMPAWTFFVAPCLTFVARSLRRAGVPVVMVVHNASDHEASFVKRRLLELQLAQASAFVTHTRVLAEALRAQRLEQRIEVHPHPLFLHYPDPTVELPRRAPLELLFFGLVRPYKGVDVALNALRLTKRTDLRLSIVGEIWEGRADIERFIRDEGLQDRVELVPRYVSAEEAASYFARADAVVLPYRSVSGSGVVPVAVRYGKPVVVSALPGLLESVRPGLTGWTFPPGDSGALARVLDTEVTAERAASMRPAIDALRASLSWDGFAHSIVTAAASQVDRRGPGLQR